MKSRTVLVIEDNAVTRKVVRLTLGKEGITVLEAGNGATGLRLASESPPDLILQDLRLPDMDGFELVARLRALPQTLGVPIIAFSGFLSRLEYGRAAAIGFTDMLPKPVEPSRLLAVIIAHLPTESAEPDGSLGGRRVLVVDDDPVQLKLARVRLAALGCEVRTAEHGAAALDVLRDGPIDVVVSDVLMPNIDGFRLCAAIRKDSALAKLPVILVSSNYVEEADRQVGMSMGASAFVVRTPDLAAVIQALRDVLAGHAPPPGSIHPVPSEHHERVVRQLERQASMNAAFAQRMSMHASMLSVVAGISEALTSRHTVDGSLPDILASLLEASGVSRGALYLATEGPTMKGLVAGELVLAASAGFGEDVVCDLERLCGHRETFDRAIAGRSPLVLSSAAIDPNEADLMARMDARSGLLLPFFAGDECLGLLVIASQTRDLTDGDWVPFARAIAVQIGQSLALSRAFAKLSASEARYRRMIETTNQGVWLMDAHGITTFVNARMAEIIGHRPSDVIGRPPADFMSPEALPVFRSHVERNMTGRARSQSEFFRSDGTSVWTLVESSPMLDDAGRYAGAFAMVMDISSERKAEEARTRAEMALRASEEQYRVLFDKSPLAKWLYDVDTRRVLAVNETATRTYGYSREEFLAMTIDVIDPPEQRPIDATAIATTAKDGPIGVSRHRKKDGTWFEAEVHAHTFTQEGASRCMVVAKDVTEQRRLEEQLRQAQKMEAVGRLAGGVAHDFNNILSVILSYGEMLVADLPPGEPIREEIDEIAKAGQRAVELTQQLLSFSRQQVLEPKVLDLNDLVAGMDKMLRRILGADIDLTTVRGEGLGRVRADPGSIEQVVMNLVVNARDAMPTGGKLTIETSNVVLDEEYARGHPGATPGPHVMIAVTDTGTGMDEATLRRIFEPFFTTKEQGKGTGLGLSTVFGIVRQSGGTVWVYSEPGIGTTFKVHLPRVDAPLEAAHASLPLPTTTRGTETILIVDDDDQVRRVACTILQRGGYRILEARNAGEALLQIENHRGTIDLLVTDVVMPQMSGPMLAQRLAASRPEMKVLCMSGYADDSIVRHGVIEGRVAFLQKPVTPRALAAKVRAVLDGEGR